MISAVNEFLDDLRGGRMTEAPIVTVEQGQLQGRVAGITTGKSFYSFQGIPYAKPPLGSLRFQAPQPPEHWDGVRDATSEGNITAQFDIFNKEYIGDENCLFLNVYTPNLDGAFLPVMVFVHGGAFRFGSGNADMYGADYLVEKDVVIVTLNYRCGVLGFLSLNTPEVPGNAGLKDVVEALRWIKLNIHNFGGNSGNITVFGESAGGAAVSLLTVSPLSKHLISKAIIQSGTALGSFVFQKSPLENARTIADALGCESADPEEILEFLRACSAKEIVETHEKVNASFAFVEQFNLFTVVVEKEFPGVEALITESFYDFLTTGRVAEIPIMIGVCTLEFGTDKKYDDLQFFVPKNLNIEKGSAESLEIAEKFKELYFKDDEELGLAQLISDGFLKVDTHRVAQYLVQCTNKPIYYYNFDYVGALNIHAKVFQKTLKYAGHMDELGYLFRNDFQKDVEISEEDNNTRERMVRLWTNFAKSGNPTPEESHYLTVNWLPITKDNLYYLNIGSELTLGINLDKEKMDYWESLYRKHFRIWEHPKTNQDELLIKYDPPVVVGTFTETVTTSSSEYKPSSEFLSESTTVTTVSNEVLDGSELTTEVRVTSSEVSEVNNFMDEPILAEEPSPVVEEPAPVAEESAPVVEESVPVVEESAPAVEEPALIVHEPTPAFVEPVVESPKFKEPDEPISLIFNNHVNGDRKVRTSNEIKMVTNSNGAPKDVIRANDPPEDDLPKNIGVNKFVNFFESLGGKK